MYEDAWYDAGWYDDDPAWYGRQSETACCPRDTIPDSCNCLDGCTCPCADCDCGRDADG